MKVRRLIGLAALCLAGVARADAPSADEHARAAEIFGQAQAAFSRREFSAAAAAFEQAASFEAHPAALLNAAEAWEAVPDPARAAEDCDRVLAIPGVSPEFQHEADLR